jgi:hypothetical protein
MAAGHRLGRQAADAVGENAVVIADQDPHGSAVVGLRLEAASLESAIAGTPS